MEFPYRERWDKVIIAMKGLPCTGKSEIANAVGEWARCSVLYMDDFLSTVSLERGYNSESMPSLEEAERLRRLAFNALCKSAQHYLHYRSHAGWSPVVVIKSLLLSTFELDCLLQLSRQFQSGEVTIIIIECRIKNEHRLYDRLEAKANTIPQHKKEWYKARSRLDFEKARDDWLSNSQSNIWDIHLSNLITSNERCPLRVIRLVLDPFDDLDLETMSTSDLAPTFRDAISYLLTRHTYGARKEVERLGDEIIRDRYEVVQFDKVRRYLVEKELLRASTSRKKSKYLCPTSRAGKFCVFKTCVEQELLHHQVVGLGDIFDSESDNDGVSDYDDDDDDDDDDGEDNGQGDGDDDDDYNCGVCGERVLSEGYTCHFCILTLHKSCAELHDFNISELENKTYERVYACKSCTERGKHFSSDCKSCIFQTNLKHRMFPTIIKHNCHQDHFFSFQVGGSALCKACGLVSNFPIYGCYLCRLFYCLECVLRPGEVEHKHGGHEHVMKLMYSREGMEPEEDYWCGVCYKDMDPQYWFYSCLECPCYEVHPHCIMTI